MPAAERPSGRPMLVGLAGGICSGKTTVARCFEELGAHVLDADQTAHEVLDQQQVRDAIRARFGATVFQSDGRIDRAALASRAFASEDTVRALNDLIHPTVRARLGEQLFNLLLQGTVPCVILDIPLLIESSYADQCDAVCFVEASEAVRESRARERGWPPDELRRREARQVPLDQKLARARFTIRNESDLESTRAQVVLLWETLLLGRGSDADTIAR